MKEYLQEYIENAPRRPVKIYSGPKFHIDWVGDIFMLPIYLGILALNLFIWVYLPYKVVSMLYHGGGFWVAFGFVWAVLAVIYAALD